MDADEADQILENEMAEIIDCDARECLYNTNGQCSTFAITVGSTEPCCDTFMNAAGKGGIPGIVAGVGACHMSSCAYNNMFECTAEGIHVSVHDKHADCGTYQVR